MQNTSDSFFRKTVGLSQDFGKRVCHKLEPSMSPSIVAADKKGFEMLNTSFNRHKYKYWKAANRKRENEREYLKDKLQ